MDWSLLALRVAIVAASFTPIAYGFSAWFRPDAVLAFTRFMSGGEVAPDAKLRYLMKPLGLYMLMFGLLFLSTIVDPDAHAGIVLWGAATLFLRFLQRALLSRELHALFGISIRRNLWNCAYLLVVVVALVALVGARSA